MELLIVTGQSGAGKTRVINALEDIGYYCVDNIPPALLGDFADLNYSPAARYGRTAIVMDARSGRMFRELPAALEELHRRRIPYRILFLEASDDVLLRRYKENRRRHPLLDDCEGNLKDAIREEARLLGPIRESADYCIDTTALSPNQLRGRIVSLFEGEPSPMLISCVSFGFRNGLPQDADLIFDVRCLPNPYYVPELKEHDGTEKAVCDYVMDAPESHEMLQKLRDLLGFSIPLYLREGKSQLVIGVGCTGGRHRSVAIACQLAASLGPRGYRVERCHGYKDITPYGAARGKEGRSPSRLRRLTQAPPACFGGAETGCAPSLPPAETEKTPVDLPCGEKDRCFFTGVTGAFPVRPFAGPSG